MLVQEPEQIDDRRHRRRLAAFVPRKGVVAAAGQPRGIDLAQPEFPADATNIFALPLTFTKHELISCRRISPCALGIELHFAARKRSESGHLTTIARRFREVRKKAGLPKTLVLYCGRHDYGTRILKQTGNLAAVMKTMGHKDVKTAMQYQHPELEIVRVALNQTGTAIASGA